MKIINEKKIGKDCTIILSRDGAERREGEIEKRLCYNKLTLSLGVCCSYT